MNRHPSARRCRAGVRAAAQNDSAMLVLGIDPGTASTGYGVVRSAGSRMQALQDRGDPDRLRRSRSSGAWPTSTRESATCSTSYRPRRAGGRGALLRGQCPDRVRGRAGPRGRAARGRPARHPVALLHPAAGQGRRLRKRARGQGPGGADGRPAARPASPPTPDHAADALAVAICDLNRAPLAGVARPRRGGAAVIALISGTVAVRRADHVVIDAGGVGYRLAVSAETLKQVPAVGLARSRCTRTCCFGIAEKIIGGGDLLELLLGGRVAGIEVWVQLFGELAIGFLNLVGGCAARNAQHLIRISAQCSAPEASPPARVYGRRRGKLTSSKLGLVDQENRGANSGAPREAPRGLQDRIARAARLTQWRRVPMPRLVARRFPSRGAE